MTETVGDAALGVLLRRDPTMADRLELSRGYQDYLTSRYLLPQPRNALIEALRTYATAAMDVFDSLVGDLAKLCRASRVAAHVDVWSVPLSDAAQAAYCKELRSLRRSSPAMVIILVMSSKKLEPER